MKKVNSVLQNINETTNGKKRSKLQKWLVPPKPTDVSRLGVDNSRVWLTAMISVVGSKGIYGDDDLFWLFRTLG